MSDGTGTSGVLPNKIIDPTASTNSIYELLADEGTTPGYFKIHPVANTKDQTQYYLRIVHDWEDPADHSTPEHDYVRLSATGHTEFTYGLSEELMKPYYDRAGYVGGLKSGAKAAYKAAADAGNLFEMQAIVYNPANIVQYEPGYYRLHSPEDIEVDGYKIVPVRYVSGYTHQIELSNDLDYNKPVPMHFYEVEGSSSAFNLLKSKDGNSRDAGYTVSKATRGDIPIPAVEYDPASILYFCEGDADTPKSKIQTQGLYLKGVKGPVNVELADPSSDSNNEAPNERAAAVMTANEAEAQQLYIMDIGGGILLIHDNVTQLGRQYLKYLSYDQVDADHIYDLKLTHNTHTDHAKWLMQPANHLGLRVTTHSGGDGGTYGGVTYNYTTFYAPFDVMLPDTVKNDQGDITKIYHATILESANSPWSPPNDLHPKSIGRYNIEANGCPTELDGDKELFRTNDRFIPAGTPVLIAMHDATGYVKLTLPTSVPHPMSTDFISSRDERNTLGEVVDKSTVRNNILSGQYLEQKLALDASQRIYTFGLPFSDRSAMSINPTDGKITATLPVQDNAGMGFYINANPDKELGLSRGDWTRNNWYVYSNKVYYHATGLGSGTRGVEFVPVIFDDEEGLEERQAERTTMLNDLTVGSVGDGCVYDLQGRKVATKQQVEDGSWRQNLRPGIYIINGKKYKK